MPFKWSKPKPVCGISVVKREIAVVKTTAISSFGGPDRIRTDDPHNANVMRSQLRYRPKWRGMGCLFIIFPGIAFVNTRIGYNRRKVARAVGHKIVPCGC